MINPFVIFIRFTQNLLFILYYMVSEIIDKINFLLIYLIRRFEGGSFNGVKPGAWGLGGCPRIDKGASPLVPSCAVHTPFQPGQHPDFPFSAILGQTPRPRAV
jgi:hypothetical protein